MRPESPWLQCYRPVLVPGARLVCFPHAGGGASFFRRWVAGLPSGFELLAVQYPGREDRLREPVATDLGWVADQVVDALAPAYGEPVALFGHSLGAAVAYEVARRMQRGGPAPAVLIVSGRQAPVDRSRSVHLMPDDDLWRDVGQVGGTSAQVLASEELRELFVPLLRSDYRLSETYTPAPGPALTCPILACVGDRDADVDLAVVATWGGLTSAGFALRTFPGGHFYLTDAYPDIIAEIVRRVSVRTDLAATWPYAP